MSAKVEIGSTIWKRQVLFQCPAIQVSQRMLPPADRDNTQGIKNKPACARPQQRDDQQGGNRPAQGQNRPAQGGQGGNRPAQSGQRQGQDARSSSYGTRRQSSRAAFFRTVQHKAASDLIKAVTRW